MTLYLSFLPKVKNKIKKVETLKFSVCKVNYDINHVINLFLEKDVVNLHLVTMQTKFYSLSS